MEGSETPGSPKDEALRLWYDLSRLYSRAASTAGRSARLGFTVTLIAGALVLLSAPLFGTGWVGPFAPLIPLVLGLVSGFGMFLAERTAMRRRESSLAAALADFGLDAGRPGANGLAAYYDAQLILLRSEYEYLLEKKARRSARLFEASFGFTPEDEFRAGPLDVLPDSPGIAALRERWERRMTTGRERAPEVGLREDRAYRFYPREMTIGAERVVREAYLTISLDLARNRYGVLDFAAAPQSLRSRIEREAEEYRRLTGMK
ncbi:MAG: hypothetical protein ACR2KW_10900 [Rubrobacter sp.]